MKQRLKSIDSWRAIAALGVLYTHTLATLDFPTFYIFGFDLMRVLNLWGNGVQLFFVISGFCFFYYFDVNDIFDKHRIKIFYKKRWFRIAPAFYSIAFVLAIYHFNSLHDFIIKIIVNIFFLQNTIQIGQIDSIFWSLSVEFQFYLLLPFVYILFRKYKITVVAFSILLLNVILCIFQYSFSIFNKDLWWYSIGNNIGHFSWGFLIAHIYRTRKKITLIPSIFLFILGLTISYLGKYLFSSNFIKLASEYWFISKSIGPLIMTLGFSMMILITLLNDKLSSLIGNSILSSLGKISYSFYLLHSSVLMLAYSICKNFILNTSFHVFVLMFITLIILIPLSYFSYSLLELPYFNSKKENYSRK